MALQPILKSLLYYKMELHGYAVIFVNDNDSVNSITQPTKL